jgi:lysyl-tRNA synthetase class 2
MPSSVIRYFNYDAGSARLLVVFQTGRKYLYHDVPERVVSGMRRAFSKGEYFNEHVRGHFPYERIDEEAAALTARRSAGPAPRARN